MIIEILSLCVLNYTWKSRNVDAMNGQTGLRYLNCLFTMETDLLTLGLLRDLDPDPCLTNEPRLVWCSARSTVRRFLLSTSTAIILYTVTKNIHLLHNLTHVLYVEC